MPFMASRATPASPVRPALAAARAVALKKITKTTT
jgi:hypothetical protein